MGYIAKDGLTLLRTLGLPINWESNFSGRWTKAYAAQGKDLIATTAALYSSPHHRHTTY